MNICAGHREYGAGALAQWGRNSGRHFLRRDSDPDKEQAEVLSYLTKLLIGRVFIVNFGTKTSLKNEASMKLLRRISCIS